MVVAVSTTVVIPPTVWVPWGSEVVEAAQTTVVSVTTMVLAGKV